MYVTLQSSTCFEHYHAHLQGVKLYYYSIWYRHSLNGCTVRRLRADSQNLLSTGVLYIRLQRVTIPDAVIIQFDLLKMSMVLLETCRGL